MSTVDEIKSAIEQLNLQDRAELARWLHGWEDDDWDKQIAADVEAGKLNKLLAEVDEDVRAGRLRDLLCQF